MECDAARDAYSALLDGELSAMATRSLDAHLAECSRCAAFAAAADQVQRSVRVRPAESVPDLTDAILARVHPPRLGRGEWIRWALVAVALTQLTLALPALVLADETGTTAHEARHIGAMSAALALGLLYTAWRPQRAYGVLPIVAALAAIMVATAAIDATRNVTPLLGESTHVVELVGFVLVWLLAGSPGAPTFRRRRRLADADGRSAASWERAA